MAKAVAKPNRRKKRRREPRESRPPASQQSAGEILRRAEQQLQEGRYKRAREGFRRLFALDPDTHRAQFIESTKLAAGEAVAANRLKEARQYFAQMDEIGVPALEFASLRLDFAQASGDLAAVTDLANQLLETEDPESRVQGADALVLAQSPEAAPVCRAITLLCAKDWAGLTETLREIGRKSPFAHWRLFLRGCSAFYQGDREEAGRFFARLPEKSVPARKIPAFELLAGKISEPTGQAVHGACQLAGDAKFGAGVVEVEELWRERKFRQAYQTAKRLKLALVWDASLRGQLTRFFQFADLSLPNQEEQFEWMQAWPQILGHKMPKLDAEGLLIANITARNAANLNDPEFADNIWITYLKNRNQLRPASPRFQAICCLARARVLDPTEGDPYLGWDAADEPEIYEPSIRALLQGIDADPTYEPVYIRLINLYGRLDRKSEANKLLDQITARFPNSKAAQFEAGLRCLDRKSYAKGLKFLRRAQEIDPLDGDILSAIRRGLESKAIEHYRKKSASQIAKGREALAELLEAIPTNPKFGASREFALVHWGLLEEISVKPADSLCDEKLAEAERELHPHVFAFYRNVMGEILGQDLKNSAKYLFGALPKLKDPREPACALQLLRLWLKVNRSTKFLRMEWGDWVGKYLIAATRALKAEDRQLSVEILETCDEAGFLWKDAAEHLIRKRLKLDRNDPLFVCRSWDFAKKPPSARKIRKTRQEAEKRGDSAALEAIALFEESLFEPTPAFMPPGVLPPTGFDDFADDFADDVDAGFTGSASVDHLISLLGPLSIPERIKMLTEMGMPHKEATELSILIGAISEVRADLPDPRPTRPTRPKRRQKTPNPDHEQLEMPF